MNATPEAGRRSDAAEPEVTDAAAAALPALRRVVVPTDESDPALARARQAALRLARTHGFAVVLYDRSDERWTDTPHPTGPLSIAEVDDDKRAHLVRQMRDFEAAGITVSAWLSSIPALTAMLDVIQELQIDGVILPDGLDKPKLMDRVTGGSDIASMVERFAELQVPKPPTVLMVPASGPISRINPKTEENTP